MSETIVSTGTEATSQPTSTTTEAPVTPTALVEPTPSRTSIRDAFDAISADELIAIGRPNSLSQPESSSTEVRPNEETSTQVAPGDEEAQAEEVSTSESTEEDSTTPPTDELPLPRRTIKASLDSESWEIPDNAKVEYKVNGVPVTRTIKEVLQMQSGIENTDRYWQQLKKEKENWSGYIANIVEQTKAGKGLEAITKAIADQGQDPVAFQRQLLNSLVSQGREYLEMTDEQRKALELQQENEYYRNQMQQREALAREEAQRQAAVRAIAEVETRYGMPQGSWSELYAELETAQKAGQIPEQDITIDDVGRYYKIKSAYNMVGSVISQHASHATVEAADINKLVQAVQERDLSEEELVEIIGKRWPKHKPATPAPTTSSNSGRVEKNLSEKLATSPLVQSLTPTSDDRTEASGPRRRPREMW